MSANTIDYRGNLGSANQQRKPSPNIWGDCPWNDIVEGAVPGYTFYDDFQDFPLVGTQTTQIWHGKYKLYAAAGCLVSKLSAVNSVELLGGALSIATDTDNDEASIAQAYPTFLMSGDTARDGKLWFEACVAQASIATAYVSSFFGLAETDAFTLASNVPNNSGDAIDASGSIIGFRIEENGLGVVDTVVSDRATSFTNIGDTEGGTLAANVFSKFGFVYDPAAETARRIVFYQNNLECATKYTGANLTATTNLKANSLGLIWSAAAATTAAQNIYMKWWRCAQIAPN